MSRRRVPPSDATRRIVESTLVGHTAFEEAVRRIRQGLAFSLDSPEPICMALVGESRTGKTRVLEEVAFDHPTHRTAEGLIVPILRIRVPAKPTIIGLAELLLRALGDPRWDNGTQNNKTARLQKLLVQCKTVMLMLDEFHHFFDSGTRKVFYNAADWLKILVDETRVTLVVSGLESCMPVLLRNEQLSGRFLAPIYMRRFNWHLDDDREEFIGILAAFTETLTTEFDMPDLAAEEMAFRCWCSTGGLIGYLSKLLRQAVWNALDAGSDKIDLEDLRCAHGQAIWTNAHAAGASSEHPSPFDRNFPSPGDLGAVARALKLGVPHEDRQQSGSVVPGTAPGLATVLSARG